MPSFCAFVEKWISGVLASLFKAVFGTGQREYSRRWPRLLMSEPARLSLPDGRQIPVLLTQLSVGGARVQTTARLREGTTAILALDIGLGLHHDITVQILRAQREERGFYFQCALRFIDVDSEKIKSIAAFIADEQQRRRSGLAIPTN